MWPFKKPKPDAIEEMFVASFVEMGRMLDEGRKESDAKIAARKRAENHKQWSQSICRQAREVKRLRDGAGFAFRVSCYGNMRYPEYYERSLRSAIGQQIASQERQEKLRRTLRRYGVAVTGWTYATQARLKRRFEGKVWLEREKRERMLAEAERLAQVTDHQ